MDHAGMDFPRAIKSGMTYLLDNSTANGSFNYIQPVNHNSRKKYNVLRHAGTIYALTQGYWWARENMESELAQRIRTCLIKSSTYLKTFVNGLPGTRNLNAIWCSGGRPTQFKEYKLGVAGLGLLALVGETR